MGNRVNSDGSLESNFINFLLKNIQGIFLFSSEHEKHIHCESGGLADG
jgi:hypothetical protein